jgi:hypothetical protein
LAKGRRRIRLVRDALAERRDLDAALRRRVRVDEVIPGEDTRVGVSAFGFRSIDALTVDVVLQADRAAAGAAPDAAQATRRVVREVLIASVPDDRLDVAGNVLSANRVRRNKRGIAGEALRGRTDRVPQPGVRYSISLPFSIPTRSLLQIESTDRASQSLDVRRSTGNAERPDENFS